MRIRDLRPPRLYRVKTAVYQTARPGLLLDTHLWDLQVTGADRTFDPAPEDATWGGRLNHGTGTRRGLLVVHANPGAFLELTEDDVAARLTALCARVEDLGFPQKAATSLPALQDEIEEPLLLSVVRQHDIVQPWDRPTIQYRCPGAEGTKCGTAVSPGGSSRLRNHLTPAGDPCPRSNTSLTQAEREAGRIIPAA
jgi:hypothetical protein